MDKNDSSGAKGDNKISRLQFLRLLGASAIGYFAYRAGFINSLFRNATAETGGWLGILAPQKYVAPSLSPQTGWLSAGTLDEDGILMMAKPKPDGYSYRFDPTVFPSIDIKLDVTGTAGLEIKQEGSVRYIRFTSHKPGKGAGNYTARLHIYTEDRADEDKQRYTWIDGAQEMGWLTHPNDLKNGEWTFICRPNKILDNTNAISAKLGGGEHSVGSPKNDEASCWNVNWYYELNETNVITFEYTHPDYEHGHDVKILNRYKPLGDRWFGCKVISMVRPDQSARDIVTYFNEDPIDLDTGQPKNDGWKKYFEFTHTGQGTKYDMAHTWGGAKSIWRNDQLTNIDVAYMNHREIIAFE
jgi:hypothetical protein